MNFGNFANGGKAVLILLSLIILSACATVNSTMTAEQSKEYFFQGSNISWDLSEKRVKKDAAKKDKGKRAAQKADLIAKLETALENEFKNTPSGSNPMRFEVRITDYYFANVLGTVWGAQSNFVGDVDVIDVSTGETLATVTDLAGNTKSVGGLLGLAVKAATKPDVGGVIASSFAKRLRKKYAKVEQTT